MAIDLRKNAASKEVLNHVVLVSHSIYGSCYNTEKDTLTKSLKLAKQYPTYDAAAADEERVAKLHKEKTYANSISSKFFY